MSHTTPPLPRASSAAASEQRGPIRIVRTVAELRTVLAPDRRAGQAIGLVPTMGALHEGHLSLIRRAREQCAVVVVSLFVNPSQFNETADLERYPRRESEDAELAGGAGADVLFAPSLEEVYPDGFATSVEVHGLSDVLEGRARGREHFRGVSTIVTKLLSMAMPDVAYFGQKDAQQVLVIRRLALDLNLPVRIEACPIVREADGLAMSSRNALLSEEERGRALALAAALGAARELAGGGERTASVLLDGARQAMRELGVEPEYLALVDPNTLKDREDLASESLLAVAARIGEIRLIDNELLTPAPVHAGGNTNRITIDGEVATLPG